MDLSAIQGTIGFCESCGTKSVLSKVFVDDLYWFHVCEQCEPAPENSLKKSLQHLKDLRFYEIRR
jgi:hypothetical protein